MGLQAGAPADGQSSAGLCSYFITEDATDYQRVKAAIFHRYNITEDMYWRRFRDARKQSGESFTEMVIRLYDGKL